MQFIDEGDHYEVRYGKSPFYLYKKDMYDQYVQDLLGELEIEMKLDREGGLHIFYKGEEIPTYVMP